MQRRRFFPALGQSENPVLSWNRFAANTRGRTYLAIRQYICRKSRYSQALDFVPFRGTHHVKGDRALDQTYRSLGKVEQNQALPHITRCCGDPDRRRCRGNGRLDAATVILKRRRKTHRAPRACATWPRRCCRQIRTRTLSSFACCDRGERTAKRFLTTARKWIGPAHRADSMVEGSVHRRVHARGR